MRLRATPRSMTEFDGTCSLRLRTPCEWDGVVYEAVTAVAPVPLLSGGWPGWEALRAPTVYLCCCARQACPLGRAVSTPRVNRPCLTPFLPRLRCLPPWPAVLSANETAEAEALVAEVLQAAIDAAEEELAIQQAAEEAAAAAPTVGDGSYVGACEVKCGGSAKGQGGLDSTCRQQLRSMGYWPPSARQQMRLA